jgi:hypothetical protein
MKVWMPLLLLTLATGLQAAEDKAVPVADVRTANGALVPLSSVLGTGREVLVLVSNNGVSERLLAAMAGWPAVRWTAKTLVVVSGTPDNARRLISGAFKKRQASVRWAADEKSAIAAAFDEKSGALFVGLEDQKIRWTLEGMANAPTAVKPVVENWLKNP